MARSNSDVSLQEFDISDELGNTEHVFGTFLVTSMLGRFVLCIYKIVCATLPRRVHLTLLTID